MKDIGIYKIENKVNGKIYIGSSIDIKKRWIRHIWDLKKNKHHSIILQRAWNKYGEENFTFKILRKCNVDNILIIEQHYLNKYLPIYNICANAGNSLGRKDSLETKIKKRNIALELKLKPPTPNKKPVEAITNEGKIISFDSLLDACEFLKKDRSFVSTISRAIKRNIKAYGYKWKYKK